jgi:hypothetical protein
MGEPDYLWLADLWGAAMVLLLTACIVASVFILISDACDAAWGV